MCLFGGAPSASAAMPVPPPLPTPPPDAPTQVDPAVTKARTDAQTKARAAAGMSSTDVTKGGLVTPATTTPKTATGQ